MTTDIDRFLSRQHRVASSLTQWGVHKLKVRGYLSAESPPTELVTSVRAIVLRGDQVLVMHNLDSHHILPGGRIEQGESHLEALRRELLEEDGAEIEVGRQIGIIHFEHITPKPEEYAYPYPDFLQRVYAASLLAYVPPTKIEDEWETGSQLLPLSEVGETLEGHEKAFLEAAVEDMNPTDRGPA